MELIELSAVQQRRLSAAGEPPPVGDALRTIRVVAPDDLADGLRVVGCGLSDGPRQPTLREEVEDLPSAELDGVLCQLKAALDFVRVEVRFEFEPFGHRFSRDYEGWREVR